MSPPIVILVATFGLLSCVPKPDELPPHPASCGGGSWRPGWLEIHHIDIGTGVSTLIVSPTGRSLLVDIGESKWDGVDGALAVGTYIHAVLGCKNIDTILLTHFHFDHAGIPGYGGLWHLTQIQGFVVKQVIHRDFTAFVAPSVGTVASWKAFFESSAGLRLHPQSALSGERGIDLGGGVQVEVVAAHGDGVSLNITPLSENDASIVLLLRFGLLDYLTAGDLSGADFVGEGYRYTDLETPLARLIRDVDVYRVSHHGSRHASNHTFLAQMKPRVSILQVGDENDNGHPHPSVVNRLLALSVLYLTQHGDRKVSLGPARVLGHVVLQSRDGHAYYVGNDFYRATDPPRKDADGDGYYSEADPDDLDRSIVPARYISAW